MYIKYVTTHTNIYRHSLDCVVIVFCVLLNETIIIKLLILQPVYYK